MKLRLFPLLSLLVAVVLLIPGAPLPVVARTEPESAGPAADTPRCQVSRRKVRDYAQTGSACRCNGPVPGVCIGQSSFGQPARAKFPGQLAR